MSDLDELKSIVRDVGIKLCERMDELEVEIDAIREESRFGMGFASRVESDMQEILQGRRPKAVRKRIKQRRTSDDWALVALYGLLGERLGVE